MFLNTYGNYVAERLSFEKILTIGFVCLLAMVYFLIWLPYMQLLGDRIKRTKGLLNMIPLFVLKKNQLLREALAENGAIDVVK